MGKEIEVKYLLMEDGRDYSADALNTLFDSLSELESAVIENGVPISQGYFPVDRGYQIAQEMDLSVDFQAIEARLRSKGNRFYLTLKGEGNLARNELEQEINKELFHGYWDLTAGKRVEKIRLDSPYMGFNAEIDVYTDRKLIVAEIEIPSLELVKEIAPLGLDISENQEYKNKNLAK